VDSLTGLAHSAVVTAVNVHAKHSLTELLHGQEDVVYGDCAYASQKELIQTKAPKARDVTNRRVHKGSPTEKLDRMVNRAKSQVRARVEHVFGVIKRLWGFSKVRLRGLANIFFGISHVGTAVTEDERCEFLAGVSARTDWVFAGIVAYGFCKVYGGVVFNDSGELDGRDRYSCEALRETLSCSLRERPSSHG
jgi:Transposase DDE domain